MTRQRALIKRLKVGDYDFDICINRTIAYNAFKSHDKIWKGLNKVTDEVVDGEVKKDALSDLERMNEQIDLYDDIVDFITDTLPAMIKAADDGADIDVDAFIEYCDDNGVLMDMCNAVMSFIIEGFTSGKVHLTAEKPKLQVSLK